MSGVTNEEIEKYILNFPDEKFDNTAIATSIRFTKDANVYLYADVQQLWNRYQAYLKGYKETRKAIREAIDDLNNILEE